MWSNFHASLKPRKGNLVEQMRQKMHLFIVKNESPDSNF